MLVVDWNHIKVICTTGPWTPDYWVRPLWIHFAVGVLQLYVWVQTNGFLSAFYVICELMLALWTEHFMLEMCNFAFLKSVGELDYWAPLWIRDDATSVCLVCCGDMSRLRRHHCRACGAVSGIVPHFILAFLSFFIWKIWIYALMSNIFCIFKALSRKEYLKYFTCSGCLRRLF